MAGGVALGITGRGTDRTCLSQPGRVERNGIEALHTKLNVKMNWNLMSLWSEE